MPIIKRVVRRRSRKLRISRFGPRELRWIALALVVSALLAGSVFWFLSDPVALETVIGS